MPPDAPPAIDVEPEFLVAWVRAELESSGEASALSARAAQAAADGLGDEDAELEAAQVIAHGRGFLRALEDAALPLARAAPPPPDPADDAEPAPERPFALALAEARGAAEWVERRPDPAAVPLPFEPDEGRARGGEVSAGTLRFRAALFPRPGAAGRLRALAERLAAAPASTRAELEPILGGSPGCAAR